MCRKAAYKLHALHRIRKYLRVRKAKRLDNAFINSQFTFDPLIWIFAGKLSIAKICKIHFRTLQVVSNSYDKLCHDLLNWPNIPPETLTILIEVYESLMNINQEFGWKILNKNQFSTIYESAM